MKKAVLLLTISLVCILSHAQRIDKKLLIGRWNLYSQDDGIHRLCRDSVEQYIAAQMNARRTDTTVRQTSGDSLSMVQDMRHIYRDIFKAAFFFDKNGRFTAQHAVGEYIVEDTKLYEWSGADTILRKRGEATEATYIILSLSPTRLVVHENDMQKKKEKEMTFTRAK